MAHDSFPEAIPFRTLDRVPGGLKALAAVLVLIGAMTAFAGVAAEEPDRFWQAFLFNWLFWSSMSLGMVILAIALHIANGHWAWSIRRFALGGAAFLPVSFVLLIVAFFGYETYFHHWLHVEGDPVIEAKRAWLNMPSLVTRDVLAVVILYGLAIAFAYYAVRPDVYGVKGGRNAGFYARLTRGFRGVNEEALHSKDRMTRLAPTIGILYALLWGMIGVDLAMTMAPHWFSTMFPVAFIWTGFHGGVAATIIAVVAFRKPLRLESFITKRQFHDLGKMLFAWSVFWMYLNWSQYVVIWYGLLPWEQDFFVRRFADPYGTVAQAVVLMVFVVPFFGLLTKPPKTVPAILAGFAAIVLIGHWLERFLITVPSIWEESWLPLGLPEIGIALGFGGLFLAAYLWFVSRVPMLPSPAQLAVADSPVVAVAAPAATAAH